MGVIAGACELPLIQPHQKKKRRDDHAQLDGPTPACLPVLRERDAHPQRAAEQQNVRNDGDLVVKKIRSAKLLVAALPCFGNVQEFFAAADFVALQGDLQTVGRVLRAEAVLFPRKFPIQAVRPLVRIGFFREKIPRT